MTDLIDMMRSSFKKYHMGFFSLTDVPHPTTNHAQQNLAHFCSALCVMGYRTGALWDF